MNLPFHTPKFVPVILHEVYQLSLEAKSTSCYKAKNDLQVIPVGIAGKFPEGVEPVALKYHR
jgi:hypothetical protein